jgi:hypothetical protein
MRRSIEIGTEPFLQASTVEETTTATGIEIAEEIETAIGIEIEIAIGIGVGIGIAIGIGIGIETAIGIGVDTTIETTAEIAGGGPPALVAAAGPAATVRSAAEAAVERPLLRRQGHLLAGRSPRQ